MPRTSSRGGASSTSRALAARCAGARRAGLRPRRSDQAGARIDLWRGCRRADLKGTWTEKTIVQHVKTASFEGDLAATSIQSCPGQPYRDSGYHGLGLYDVTDPLHPRRLGLFQTPPHGAHELWLQPVGDHAYVYAAIPGAEARGTSRPASPPDLEIVDVTDPTKPTLAGSWGAWSALKLPRPAASASRTCGSATQSSPTRRARAPTSPTGSGHGHPRRPRPAPPAVPRTDDMAEGRGGERALGCARRRRQGARQTEEAPHTHPVLFDVRNPRAPKRIGELKPPAAVVASRANLPFLHRRAQRGRRRNDALCLLVRPRGRRGRHLGSAPSPLPGPVRPAEAARPHRLCLPGSVLQRGLGHRGGASVRPRFGHGHGTLVLQLER